MVKRSNMTLELKTLLNTYELPILTTTIGERIAFAKSVITGGVFQLDDEKAQSEIHLLAKEIFTQI